MTHTAIQHTAATIGGPTQVLDDDEVATFVREQLMATDVDGVYLDFGKPNQRLLSRVTTAELTEHPFPAGSMGPKVAAAMQFVELTGKRAAIGALADIEGIVAGEKGTNVVPA